MIGAIALLAFWWLLYCVAGYGVALVSLFIKDRPDKSLTCCAYVAEMSVGELLATLGHALPLAVTWPAIAIRWMRD